MRVLSWQPKRKILTVVLENCQKPAVEHALEKSILPNFVIFFKMFLSKCKPRISYGLGKMHKESKNRLTPFHLTLSVIVTPFYKLPKFLPPILTPVTENEHRGLDSFHFIAENCKQDPNLYVP